MPFKYDPSIMDTEEGARLYDKWRYAKYDKTAEMCEEWQNFPDFYKWAMENCYEIGKILRRKGKNLCFSPDNCTWEESCEKVYSREEWINKWNKTVNRIRVAYGMEPIGE